MPEIIGKQSTPVTPRVWYGGCIGEETMNTAESVVQSALAFRRTDRRHHTRVPLQVPVLLDARSTWQASHCRDVSVSGIAVDSDGALPVGTFLEIYFELPSQVAVEARAVVVRSEPAQLGLRFLDLPREARAALSAHCRKHRAPH